MEDRKEIELTWRKEFDELGESGVREEFFKGTFQANQRKEGFTYRRLGEKGKKQQREEARRNQRFRLVVFFSLLCFVVLAAVALVLGFGEIVDKGGSALRFSWKAIAGIWGT